MCQKLAGSFFCLKVYSAEYYSLMWLSVQHDCAVWSSDHKRDYREIFFTINYDSRWWMHNCVIERANQFIG
jgi:hypothetical protein